MRIKPALCFCFLILVGYQGQPIHAQTAANVTARVMRNNDILRLVADGVKSSEIVQRIQTSNCNFDVFPPVLRDLRRRGVAETVLLAMTVVPVGPPPTRVTQDENSSLTKALQIPVGTVIELESMVAMSSAKAVEGSAITFAVTKRIFVNNVLAFERGAIAKGRVTKVKRAAALGRAGMLAWELDYVTAVDGTRVPIRLSGEQKGANRSFVMAGGAAATAALIFPYSSPVALIWGLKKGDEAVLRGSKIFTASVNALTEVAGIQPRQGGVAYRDRETVKASTAPPTNTNFEQGFKARGGFRPQRDR